jgi:hypothetical protein
MKGISPMNRHLIRILVGLPLLVGAAALAACGGTVDPDSVYTRVTEGTLSAGDSIPAPAEAVILTVTGNIENPNSDDGSIQMDLPTLESVGLVDYTVTDPFEGDEVTFRGVLMSDLLALWGVPEDAETLQMTALNDYSVDLPFSELRQYPVMLALMEDGEYMPVSTRGPSMLVFPYAHYDFDEAVYNNYWIWQLKQIDVQ